MKLIRQRPYVIEKKCIRCGICVKSCPVEGKAIKLDKDRGTVPQYDYDKCIRCYCCQEMCPKKAIEVKTPFLRRILDKLASAHL
jgi:ferredoxin